MSEEHPIEHETTKKPTRSRWLRWPAYLLFLCLFAVVLVRGVEFAAGFLVEPLTFPPNGLALPPLHTQKIDLYDFTYSATANLYGMRDKEVGPKDPDTFRIAAVGDSYTFGWGVALEEAYIKRLEHYLREDGLNVEVLNVGRPGVGPWEYLSHAEMAINELDPDMVLIGLTQGNDLIQCSSDNTRRFFPNLTRLARKDEEPWVPPGPPQPSVQEFSQHQTWLQDVAQQEYDNFNEEQRAKFELLDEELKSLFFDGKINPWMIGEATKWGEGLFSDFSEPGSVPLKYRASILTHIVKRIQKMAASIDASVAVLSIPNGVFDNQHLLDSLARMGYKLDPRILFSTIADDVAGEAVRRAGAPYYEVSQFFRDRSDDPSLYFELDHHITPKAHDLFAREIAPYIAVDIRAALSR